MWLQCDHTQVVSAEMRVRVRKERTWRGAAPALGGVNGVLSRLVESGGTARSEGRRRVPFVSQKFSTSLSV